MFGKKEAQPQKRIDGLIPAGTVIRGDIVFGGGLRIDGNVEGSIATSNGNAGTLTAMPTPKRNPAIVQTELPKFALNFSNAHGNTPLKSTAMSIAASNSLTMSPKWLLASV